jgi:hypothetical protein
MTEERWVCLRCGYNNSMVRTQCWRCPLFRTGPQLYIEFPPPGDLDSHDGTSVEASELGLPPGVWPLKVTWHGFDYDWDWAEFAAVNARHTIVRPPEVIAVHYRCGVATLVVFND